MIDPRRGCVGQVAAGEDRMPSLDSTNLFTPEAVAALRRHPSFDQVVDGLAAASLDEVAQADDTGRWMFRDLGRSSLYVAAVILDASPVGLTAATLAASARDDGAASRGRAMAFLRRAQAAGEVTAPPGDGPWTRRRLIVAPAFIERLRHGSLIYARAAAALFPDMAALPEQLFDDAFFRAYMLWLGVASQATKGATPAMGATQELFLNRDRGMSMVFRWLVSQPRPRARLLVSAHLSRSGLAAEFGVSRVHINRLLSDASAAGLLSCPAPDRVTFSQAMSDEIEQMLVVTLQISRMAYLAAVAQFQGAPAFV